MRSFLIVWLLLPVLTFPLCAQRTITGLVSGQDGFPLAGVEVQVAGTAIQTSTGIDGAYAIRLPDDRSVLVFRLRGYQTLEREVGIYPKLNVELEEGLQLDRRVRTPLFRPQNQHELGYAAYRVPGEQLRDAQQPNLINALNGHATGALITGSSGSPGASASLRLRGHRSLLRNNGPLLVLDGVPIDNAEVGNRIGGVDQSNRGIDINPQDVESVTLLSGAAGQIRYGLRGANGALLINTRRGFYGKPRVTFSAGYGVSEVNQMPGRQSAFAQGRPLTDRDGNPLGPAWRGPHTTEIFSYGPAIDELAFSNDLDHPQAPPANAFDRGRYLFDRNGFLIPAADSATARAYDPYDFFRTGNTYDLHLSVAGGGPGLQYYFAGGRHGSQGVAPEAEWERNSLLVNARADVSSQISAGLSAYYANSAGYRLQRGFGIKSVMLGLLATPPTFDNGNGKTSQDAAADPRTYELFTGAQRSYRAGVYDNPYWSINKNPTEDVVNRFIGNTNLQYRPLEWLHFNYRLGIDHYSDRRNDAIDINPFFAGGLRDPGRVSQSVRTVTNWNSDFWLELFPRSGEESGFSLLLGHNYYETSSIEQRTDGSELASPGFYDIRNGKNLSAQEFTNERALVGLHATAEWNLLNQVFLEVSARQDWSSTLPQGNRGFLTYGGSLSWMLSNSLGLRGSTWLPYAQLRLAVSHLGMDAPLYRTNDTFLPAVAGGDDDISGIGFPAFGVDAFERTPLLPASGLEPEITETIELGGRFKFYRGRVGIDLTYYNAETSGLILTRAVAATSGYTETTVNQGGMTNTGWEAGVEVLPLVNPNFSWQIGLRWATYDNQLKGVEPLQLAGTEDAASAVRPGQPYGVLVGTAFARNDDGQLLLDENGYPQPAEEPVILGDPNPQWWGSLRNEVQWKGWGLAALLDIRVGNEQWCGSCGAMDYFGTSARTGALRDEEVVFQGLLPDGAPNDQAVPYYDPEGRFSDIFWTRYGFGGLAESSIYDAGWLRLREVTLSHQFSDRVLENLPIGRARVAITARNLWLQTDYPGIDPETNLVGTANGSGLDYFNMPNTRSYHLSMRVTFQ